MEFKKFSSSITALATVMVLAGCGGGGSNPPAEPAISGSVTLPVAASTASETVTAPEGTAAPITIAPVEGVTSGFVMGGDSVTSGEAVDVLPDELPFPATPDDTLEPDWPAGEELVDEDPPSPTDDPIALVSAIPLTRAPKKGEVLWHDSTTTRFKSTGFIYRNGMVTTGANARVQKIILGKVKSAKGRTISVRLIGPVSITTTAGKLTVKRWVDLDFQTSRTGSSFPTSSTYALPRNGGSMYGKTLTLRAEKGTSGSLGSLKIVSSVSRKSKTVASSNNKSWTWKNLVSDSGDRIPSSGVNTVRVYLKL